MSTSKKTIDKLTFEAALTRLEAIAAQLEEGKTSLEDSLALYEEGAALSAMCSARLKEARQRVLELEPDGEKSDEEE